MIIVLDSDQTAADLVRGELACPRCGGTLRPWSWAVTRWVRQVDGTSLPVRPRRARCAGCHRTQVLLPSHCQPRSGEATAVIGAALLAKAAGHGWRRIARDLDRPPATVRRWLRRARGTHLEQLRHRGTVLAADLDPDLLAAGLPPQPTQLGDTLVALAAAVAAWRSRFARHAEAWNLIGAFTSGRLLAPS